MVLVEVDEIILIGQIDCVGSSTLMAVVDKWNAISIVFSLIIYKVIFPGINRPLQNNVIATVDLVGCSQKKHSANLYSIDPSQIKMVAT